jgi:hypothetical protein
MFRATSSVFSYLAFASATLVLTFSCDEYTCQDLANCEYETDADTTSDSSTTLATEGSLDIPSTSSGVEREKTSDETTSTGNSIGEVTAQTTIPTDPSVHTSDTSTAGCNLSQQECNGTCIGSNECCTANDCPVGASCEGRVCECPINTHPCEGECVSNASPQTCGQACSPCQEPAGGTATCNGTVCGGVCPTGEKLCAGECIDNSRSCTGGCPSGSHDCSGLCASDEDVTSCGSSCSPCAVPSNAAANCNDGTCGYACDSGFKPCGDGCIHDSACCDDTECDVQQECSDAHVCQCANGFDACGSECIPSGACCSAGDCDSIPAPSCIDDTTQRTFSNGACLNTHACEYPYMDTTCSLGCANGACTTLHPIQVTMGAMHACALMTDQTVYCWGEGGRLGNGSPNQSLTPAKVSGIDNAIQISAGGGNTTCARLTDQTIKCWGEQTYGQTGQGKITSYALTPTAVPGVTGANDVQASGTSNVVCASLSNGTVRCWGADADFVNVQTPTTVTGLTACESSALGRPRRARCSTMRQSSVGLVRMAHQAPSPA